LPKHLGDAVDQVHRAEHRALKAQPGESPLTRSRYLWLRHPDRMTDKAWAHFENLKLSAQAFEKDVTALSRCPG